MGPDTGDHRERADRCPSGSTLDKLRDLKALGLNLAIDDFGTGYSSLGYLQQFPIDVLKIDRTFVDAVGMEDEDPILARAIIALGRTLQIETIAEGVERPEQRERLGALGCTLGQGYLFARPLEASRFAEQVLGRNYGSVPRVELMQDREPARRPA